MSLPVDLAHRIVDGAWVGLVLLGEGFAVEAWNAWMEKASGLRAAEILGRPLGELAPGFLARHEPDLEEVVENGGYRFLSALLHRELLPLREPDGAYLAHDILVGSLDVEGERRRLLLTVRSVAEHVRAYRDLERLFHQVAEGKRLWEAAFDAVDELIWVVDPAGTVLRANRALARRAGKTFPEIIGKPCPEVMGGGDGCRHCLAASPEGGDGMAPCLGPAYRFAAYPVGDGNLVCTALNLAPVRRAWEQAARAEKTFSLVRLVAGAAHELNNPLAAIAGAAEVALLACDDPGLRRKLDLIEAQAHRAANILHRLQESARIRTGPREPVDLAEAWRRARRGLVFPAGVRFAEEAPDDLPAVMGQPARLEALFAALLDNALKAVADAGEIRVRARHDAEAGEVVVTVEDSGPGFAEEALPHVFDPFFTTREVGKGAGLGLSECQGIVADHGGTIEAGNRPEGGARVTLRLPVAGTRVADHIPPVGTHDRMLAGLSGGGKGS